MVATCACTTYLRVTLSVVPEIILSIYGEIVIHPGLGTRTGSILHKTTTKELIFVFKQQAKRSNPRQNGSLVFNDIHSRGQIRYESLLRFVSGSTT